MMVGIVICINPNWLYCSYLAISNENFGLILISDDNSLFCNLIPYFRIPCRS